MSAAYAEHLLPRLERQPAPCQFVQGKAASAFLQRRTEERLTRPGGERRSLFVRMADQPFDDNARLLAYVAPSYSRTELATLPRAERATFNLDLVEAGWAAPFVIYPLDSGRARLSPVRRHRGRRHRRGTRNLGGSADAARLRVPRRREAARHH